MHGLVLVTVAAGTRRADLALPGALPVAELLPELARLLGLLDGAAVHEGYRLVAPDGRPLAPGEGLAAQGIEDGALLTVVPGTAEPRARVHDDPAEALVEAVASGSGRWSRAAGQWTALGAGTLLAVLGAAALVPRHDALATTVASLAAATLLLGALAAARHGRGPATAVTAAWLATLYAAMAGVGAIPGGAVGGQTAAAAGAGAVLVGLLALAGTRERRVRLLPPVAAGAVLLGTGTLVELAAFDPAVVLTTVLVLVVLSGSVFPWLVLAASGAAAHRAPARPGVAGLDVDAIGVAARAAHELLAALSATVGLLLVLVAPLAVGLGVSGTVLAVLACLAVALRTRQYGAGAEVLVGLVSAILGLAATAAAVLLLHPGWRPVAGAVLAASGAALLAASLWPATSSVRLARVGDLAESAALLAMLPLLVLAAGLYATIRG